jgi:hypothetical protein
MDAPETLARPADDGAWIRDAARATVGEARLYLTTLLLVCFRPRRFVEVWTGGGRRMNPFAFVATSAALSTFATECFVRRAGIGGSGSLAFDLAHAIGPYLCLACTGVLAHGVFRLARSARRLPGSLAIALFAGGGPALLMTLFIVGTGLLLAITRGYVPKQSFLQNIPGGLRAPFLLTIYGLGVWQYVLLGRAMHLLHRVRWVWSVLAILLPAVLLAVFFGFVHRVLGVGAFGWLHASWWRGGIDFYL